MLDCYRNLDDNSTHPFRVAYGSGSARVHLCTKMGVVARFQSLNQACSAGRKHEALLRRLSQEVARVLSDCNAPVVG